MLKGSLEAQPPTELLVNIEQQRTSGELHFESAGDAGVVTLIAGMLAEEQPRTDQGADPVDLLLSASAGTFQLFQKLRPLPGAHGSDSLKTGALSQHPPAELMNYCEEGGLTGSLLLTREHKRAEIHYRAGELEVIRVDGSDEGDLHDVFAWTDGAFTVRLGSSDPGETAHGARQPAAPGTDPEQAEVGFLNVVEVALTSILDQRDKQRPKAHSVPPMPAAPKVRQSVSGSHPSLQPPKREPTVKVIYLGDAVAPAAEPDTSTRHVAGRHSAAPIDPVVEAASTRRPPAPTSTLRRAGGAVAWAGILLLLLAVALLVLANLPRM